MAKKTFPYAIIYGGKLIPANTPVEIKKENADKSKDENAEEKKPE